jgi:guanylate kinase
MTRYIIFFIAYFNMDYQHIIILSAPSGGGKNTLINEILSKRNDVEHSISTTTRSSRGKESEGDPYYFVSQGDFVQMISENKFLEWAKVLNNYYGTTYNEISRIKGNNHKALLDIDVQGAMQVKKNHPEVTTVFIEPPSLEILSQRLRKRGTESEEQILERLNLAREEMESRGMYDYIIINDDLKKAVFELNSLIENIMKT